MGQQHKRDNGNYMGEQEAHQKIAPESKDRVGSPKFKQGEILDGTPGLSDNFPKAGKDIAPSFQAIRNQDPKKGTI